MKPIFISAGVRNPDVTNEEFRAWQEEQRQININTLWQAAHDYEYARISGTAPAMVTLGVVKGSKRALEVALWIQSIWALYYKRKPEVTYECNDKLLDFSECGEMPYSVPELMAEILG